jgi:hypothetical protein
MLAPPGTWSARLSQPPRSLVDDLSPDEVALDERSRHHLERVLRVRAGEPIELVDGRGGLARARWAASGRARIDERLPPQPPPRDPLVLAVAPPRLPRLEWLVEKACELDVSELVLIDAARAERLPGEGRLERLQRIADEALLQCRRLHRMPVRAPVGLEALLARPRPGELCSLSRRPPAARASPVWRRARGPACSCSSARKAACSRTSRPRRWPPARRRSRWEPRRCASRRPRWPWPCWPA